MAAKEKTIEQYLNELSPDRIQIIEGLRKIIKKNIPQGFEECMNYGMISYVVPHKLYPNGYHCKPGLPLPFVSIASQKNFIAIYHMGIYADAKLLNWFTTEYPKHCKTKLDMGKSCIRFKKIDDIPLKLIGELMQKMNVQAWIDLYTKSFVK